MRVVKVLLILVGVMGVAVGTWLYLTPGGWVLSEEEQAAKDAASIECTYPWENFRILRQATTPYSNTATVDGFTVVYYEQSIGGDRHRSIALYRGPQTSWATCREKFERLYNVAVLSGVDNEDYPYAINVHSGSVGIIYTRDKSRARRLEDLPIILRDDNPTYIDDAENDKSSNE